MSTLRKQSGETCPGRPGHVLQTVGGIHTCFFILSAHALSPFSVRGTAGRVSVSQSLRSSWRDTPKKGTFRRT